MTTYYNHPKDSGFRATPLPTPFLTSFYVGIGGETRPCDWQHAALQEPHRGRLLATESFATPGQAFEVNGQTPTCTRLAPYYALVASQSRNMVRVMWNLRWRWQLVYRLGVNLENWRLPGTELNRVSTHLSCGCSLAFLEALELKPLYLVLRMAD